MKNLVRSALSLAAALAGAVAFGRGPNLSRYPWIGDGLPEQNGADWYEDDPASVFTADFVLPQFVAPRECGQLQVASPSCYLLTVNGESANGTPLANYPLWSPFDKTIYSETYEIGRLLRPYPETNRVQLVLGNGWYNPPPLKCWGRINFREHLAHGRPCFKLAIEGVDKLRWKWRGCSLVQNSYQLGETYDLLRPPDLGTQEAAEVDGPRGRIVPREAPRIGPLRRGSERGRARWLKEGKVQVIDFGHNLTAVYQFAFKSKGLKRGDRVEFVYGERLNADGSVNPLTQATGQIKKGEGGEGAPRVAAQTDAVIVGDKPSEYLMLSNYFTWHVARYVEVRGPTELIDENDALRMPVGSMLRSMKPGKTFNPKNKDLKAIHDLCVRTFLSNAMGVQSDCPGRERLQYGGDIVATCEAYALNFNMMEFYLKTLQDFADEAEDDGWITETAPYVGIRDSVGLAKEDAESRRGPVSWALVVPKLIDLVIRRYPVARKRALAFYPVCTRYVQQMNATYPLGIVPHCIGDHEALERAPDDVTATAHWHEFVKLTVKFARLMGRGDEAAKYEKIRAKIAKAFVDKYLKDGVVANGSQSAQAIALYLGLVPRDQLRAAERQLKTAIEEKDHALTTGIFSTRYMLMYLSEHGYRETAEKIVLHKGFPGWLHMIDRGATTLWETWKESDDTYSNCHPMLGSVDEWILTYGEAK